MPPGDFGLSFKIFRRPMLQHLPELRRVAKLSEWNV